MKKLMVAVVFALALCMFSSISWGQEPKAKFVIVVSSQDTENMLSKKTEVSTKTGSGTWNLIYANSFSINLADGSAQIEAVSVSEIKDGVVSFVRDFKKSTGFTLQLNPRFKTVVVYETIPGSKDEYITVYSRNKDGNSWEVSRSRTLSKQEKEATTKPTDETKVAVPGPKDGWEYEETISLLLVTDINNKPIITFSGLSPKDDLTRPLVPSISVKKYFKRDKSDPIDPRNGFTSYRHHLLVYETTSGGTIAFEKYDIEKKEREIMLFFENGEALQCSGEDCVLEITPAPFDLEGKRYVDLSFELTHHNGILIGRRLLPIIDSLTKPNH